MIVTKYLNLLPASHHISAHFLLREFRSPDVYKVKYSTTLLAKLEKVRTHFCGEKGRIEITSGYRSVAYNASVGGSDRSAHLEGKAADFRVYDTNGNLVPPRQVCLYLEKTGWVYGIGMMRTATHIDEKFVGNRMDETRKDPSGYKYYMINNHEGTFAKYFGIEEKYTGFFPSAPVGIGLGTEANILRWQKFLCWWGPDTALDKIFGPDCKRKTLDFQKANGLSQTGKADAATIAKAKTVTK